MKRFEILLVILCALAGVNCVAPNSTETAPSNSAGTAAKNGCSVLGCLEDILSFSPMSREEIDVKIYLYKNPNQNERVTVTLSENFTDFNPELDTAFITHGFANNGNDSWVNELKNAYFKSKGDVNVFIVDWGKGATSLNYFKVVANAGVVGEVLASFIKHLKDSLHVNPARIHFMGHCLGAHISSYAAKKISGIGHLTAFNPDLPGFVKFDLTPNDVKFFDVIHTNNLLLPLQGFGTSAHTDHNDYYMNGGILQPGCVLPPVHKAKLTSIADLGKISVDVIKKWVSCSHDKAYQYYTEALLNSYCTFWGRLTNIFSNSANAATFGKAGLVWGKFDECTLDKCSPIGLEAEEYPARGAFAVSTSDYSPYCNDDPKITEKMRELKNQAGNGHANSEPKKPLDTFLPYKISKLF